MNHIQYGFQIQRISKALLVLSFFLLPNVIWGQSLADLLKNLGSAGQSSGNGRNSSEQVFILGEDGASYVQFDGMRSGNAINYIVSKGTRSSDWLYFFPANPAVKSHSASEDIFVISPGGYSNMTAGKIKLNGPYLTANADGSLTYKSWDGKWVAANGKGGSWFESGFDHWGLAVVVPENIEIIKYEANVRGDWKFTRPVLRFYASGVNNVWYSITYRVRSSQVVSMETLP